MSWIYLLIAGIGEVWWATTMKLSHGFSKINYSILTIVGMIFSFYFLIKATKNLPLSIAYPIWTGVGALGSILIGLFLFKEQISPITWLFISLLLIGIIGIKATSGH
ncbi:QacE family quaternary ammonium compound efflux SMR transporter [Companilactobacillus sp. RD055328]|uniref:DMT family transporter n=1 Tax=Companilactobacillus sp. RD055328 TaxID=2916634 RepID=UPI001FC89BB6|nr:multidrug efflux SMR transporter [Companilactobacillus sp. RD055328]GKQ42196.1 QacE family quaternary ammonium compound efflux SMR transporter [Companilactobacillus sp. RD055328]